MKTHTFKKLLNSSQPHIQLLFSHLLAMLLLILSSSVAFCINNSPQDSLQAHTHLNQAKDFLEHKQAVQAVNETLKAIPLFAQQKDWENWYEAHKLLYKLLRYKDRPQLIDYLQKSLDLSVTQSIPDKTLGKINLLMAKAYHHHGNYKEAIVFYEKSALIFEKIKYDKPLPSLYGGLGRIYWLNGDDANAQLYIEQALVKATILKKESTIIQLTAFMADIYRTKENFQKADEYYQKALKIAPDDGLTNLLASKNYLEWGKLPQALEAGKKTLAAAQKSEDKRTLVDAQHNLGRVYAALKDYAAALNYYKAAYKLGKKTYGTHHIDCAKIPVFIGDVYADMQQYSKALTYYQQTINALLPSFQETNPLINPSPKQLGKLAPNIWIMEALKNKGNTFYQQYQPNKDPKYLDLALDSFTLLLQYLDALKTSYVEDDSKQLLTQFTYSCYENAIQAAITKANHSSQENATLEQAFQFAQQVKAFTLRQVLTDKKALEIAKVPKETIEQLQAKKIVMAKVNKAIYDTEIDTVKNAQEQKNQLDSLKNEQFTLKQKYDQQIQLIEREYPQYAQLKNRIPLTSAAHIQARLSENNQLSTALLEYFVGDNSIYMFALTPTSLKVYHQPKTISANFDIFRKTTSDWDYLQDSTQEAEQQYLQTAHQLYQDLLAQPLNDLKQYNIQQLIIVPDGKLGYLPFEAFLYQQANNWKAKNTPYLLKKYAISYIYSSHLLITHELLTKRQHAQVPFGGFGLEYDNFTLSEMAKINTQTPNNQAIANLNRRGEVIAKLPHAPKEVLQIAQLFGGKSWVNKKATKKNFLENARNYGILHLAMHGIIDENQPLNSALIFSKTDRQTDNLLRAADVYHLQLNADLTVLSACNTGNGELKRGEGIMSLSRAFAFAGCPSMIMNLWSVADQSTSTIMQYFYEQLKDGENKAISLQKAKLHYLKNTNPQNRTPIHWAAPVAIGDMQALDSKIAPHWVYLLIGITLLFLLCLFWFLYKKLSLWWALLIIGLILLLFFL